MICKPLFFSHTIQGTTWKFPTVLGNSKISGSTSLELQQRNEILNILSFIAGRLKKLHLDLLPIRCYAAPMNKIKWGYEIKICENTCEIDGSGLGSGLFFILNHTFIATDSHIWSSSPFSQTQYTGISIAITKV